MIDSASVADKELTKAEQLKALRSSPEWQLYIADVEKSIEAVSTQLDDCTPEELGRLQGEKKGLRKALNMIFET